MRDRLRIPMANLFSFPNPVNEKAAVIFAMLAGCAPLVSERLETCGGPPIDLRDPRIFSETSSYGPAAVDMMARRVACA